MTADDILAALIALSDSRIWATELQFFSAARRIDFFTLEPTASQGFRTSAYEIKISRADYKRDSLVKQEAALKWSDRFWYVTPPDLITPQELPDWAGLQEWDGTTFRVRRKPPMRRKAAPDWEFIVSMLRNSGDCRRDVALLKLQTSFLTARINQLEKSEKIRTRRAFDKWIVREQIAQIAAE